MGFLNIDWDEMQARDEALDRKLRDIAAALDARDAERARQQSAGDGVARETPPVYGTGAVEERLDRIERTLADLAATTKVDLEEVRRTMATKADLEEVRRTMVTKEDLEEMRRTLVTKEDLEEMRRTLVTKEDLNELRRTLATKIELEGVRDEIKRVADGYGTVRQRLDYVAELLKARVVFP
jgi:hypothetical protein